MDRTPDRTPDPPPPPGWLTAKEIAQLTNLELGMIYYIAREERLPYLPYSRQKGGRRYSPEAILTFRERAKTTAPTAATTHAYDHILNLAIDAHTAMIRAERALETRKNNLAIVLYDLTPEQLADYVRATS